MDSNKIAVVGYGYVGKAIVNMFRSHYHLVIFDPQYDSSHNDDRMTFSGDFNDSSDCLLGIVCVPTPSNEDGSCDTRLVEEAVQNLKTKIVMIKSTIEPGTTERLKQKTQKRIVFSPEYVGESKYYNPYFNSDMKAVPFFIAGGSEKDCNEVFDIVVPILGPTKTYFKTTSLNAELIKYMENAFFATKITFVNEFYNICQSLGADWHNVREGWLLDPRIEKMHTAVFPEKRGFSGKCLPKDTEALVQVAKKNGYEPTFLDQILKSNKKFQKNTNIGK